MSVTKYVPLDRVFDFDCWYVELSGLVSALSITVDVFNDYAKCDTEEHSALNGILFAIMSKQKEFKTMMDETVDSAKPLRKIMEEET